MKVSLLSVMIAFLNVFILTSSVPAMGKEFVEESEKDYPLRSMVSLQVLNAKGDVNVQGWAFDKIRVKIRKQVDVDTPEQAKRLLEGMDYRYRISDEKVEISNQYGNNLSIEERIQERGNAKSRMDVTLYAPSKLKLMMWSIDGRINLKSWNGKAEARSNSGLIRMEGVKGDNINVVCSSCSAYLKNIRGNLRCSGRSGLFSLNNITGKTIFAETESGGIKLSHIQGDQLYISQSGSINGQFLGGNIEYHANQATVDLREISGFLSGDTESGSMNGTVKEWKSKEEALIESVRGVSAWPFLGISRQMSICGVFREKPRWISH